MTWWFCWQTKCVCYIFWYEISWNNSETSVCYNSTLEHRRTKWTEKWVVLVKYIIKISVQRPLNRLSNGVLHRPFRFFRFQCNRSRDPTDPPWQFSIFCPLFLVFGPIWPYSEAWNLFCGGFLYTRIQFFFVYKTEQCTLKGVNKGEIFCITLVTNLSITITSGVFLRSYMSIFLRIQDCPMVFKISSWGFQVSGLWYMTIQIGNLTSSGSANWFLWSTQIDLLTLKMDSGIVFGIGITTINQSYELMGSKHRFFLHHD